MASGVEFEPCLAQRPLLPPFSCTRGKWVQRLSRQNGKTPTKWGSFKNKWLAFAWPRALSVSSLRNRRATSCPSPLLLPDDAPSSSSILSPSTELHFGLFNREELSDVVFLVGIEPDVWRFPGHSTVLAAASPVFGSIFGFSCAFPFHLSDATNGRLCSETESELLCDASDGHERGCHIIDITDVKPDVFQTLMRYIYTKEISFSSTASALRLLQIANRFMVYSLSEVCLGYLLSHIQADNVLEVLQQLKSVADVTDNADVDNMLNEVFISCMCLVDECAEEILQSESFEQLDYETLSEIVIRDSLRVTSELVIYEAVMRWACRECKRQRKILVPENKREMLGSILYLVRYLAMTKEEFLEGPVSEHALNEEETAAILARMRGDENWPLPPPLTDERTHSLRHYRSLIAVTSSLRTLSNRTDVCREHSNAEQHDDPRTIKVKHGNGQKAVRKLFQKIGDFFICVIQLLD